MFVERILPASVLRSLTEEEMGEYRRPFDTPGDGRLPILIWRVGVLALVVAPASGEVI